MTQHCKRGLAPLIISGAIAAAFWAGRLTATEPSVARAGESGEIQTLALPPRAAIVSTEGEANDVATTEPCRVRHQGPVPARESHALYAGDIVSTGPQRAVRLQFEPRPSNLLPARLMTPELRQLLAVPPDREFPEFLMTPQISAVRPKKGSEEYILLVQVEARLDKNSVVEILEATGDKIRVVRGRVSRRYIVSSLYAPSGFQIVIPPEERPGTPWKILEIGDK